MTTTSSRGRNSTDGADFRLSFEFFPPKSESGMDSLTRVVGRLKEAEPDFFSCTYGAGGSTRDGTRETIARLISLGVEAAPHLSIGADSQSAVFDLLNRYRFNLVPNRRTQPMGIDVPQLMSLETGII